VFPGIFLAGGNKLIVYSRPDGRVLELETTTGRELQSWRTPMSFQGAAGLSPDERLCMTIGYEGETVLRNLADESQTTADINILEGSGAAFSPDGKLFAASSDLGFARVWDSVTWGELATLGGFLNGAQSVSFSPDGKRLVLASGGKEALKLFDSESWQDVLTLEGQGSDGHGLAFSPDENDIGWLNSSGVLQVWQAPSWEQITAEEAKQ
jgi:WD40 repeat protein